MLKGIAKKLAGTRSAVTSAMDELDVLRASIVEKRQEIETLRRAPIPVGEALKAFDTWAANRAEDAITRLRPEHLVDPAHPAGELRLPDFSARVEGEFHRADDRADDLLFALIMATAMPAVRSIVEERLEQATAGRPTLTRTERVERIAEAEAELLALELSEEATVRSLEAAGLPVERRADADPRAVLASESSLPA
jgi:hypothetical protein